MKNITNISLNRFLSYCRKNLHHDLGDYAKLYEATTEKEYEDFFDKIFNEIIHLSQSEFINILNQILKDTENKSLLFSNYYLVRNLLAYYFDDSFNNTLNKKEFHTLINNILKYKTVQDSSILQYNFKNLKHSFDRFMT